MKVINSWKAPNKQNDKASILIRVGKLTIFEVYFDISKKEYRALLFNFGVRG